MNCCANRMQKSSLLCRGTTYYAQVNEQPNNSPKQEAVNDVVFVQCYKDYAENTSLTAIFKRYC